MDLPRYSRHEIDQVVCLDRFFNRSHLQGNGISPYVSWHLYPGVRSCLLRQKARPDSEVRTPAPKVRVTHDRGLFLIFSPQQSGIDFKLRYWLPECALTALRPAAFAS